MSDPKMRTFLASLGPNEGYAEELFRLYSANREAVPEYWRTAFDSVSLNGSQAGKPDTKPVTSEGGRPTPSPSPALQSGDRVQPLRGAAARIAANMESSLSVPTATSQRAVPVALLEDTRKRLNRQLADRGVKVSITHLLGWALVQAAREIPALNSAYAVVDGVPSRIERAHINLGLAVDVEGKDGTRSLMVPVVKAAESLSFPEFVAACDRLIQAARAGKPNPDDLQGATLTLTNPGTLGTRASVPRLMPGQAAIIAVGAMAYPPGFETVAEDRLQDLGVAKTVTLSCTYDHRVVQGAESGQFLARVHQFLLGADGYYEQITASLAGATARSSPPSPPPSVHSAAPDQVWKQAAVYQLVHAYRVRGHLMANVDPMSFDPIRHPELEPDHFGLTPADLNREFLTLSIGDAHAGEEAPRPLRAILESLQATYCGTLSCEYMHIQRLDERQWLQAEMEPSRNQAPLEAGAPARILEKLTQAEAFERLLHTRYVGHKRFSLEGGEALIPAIDRLLNLAGADGVRYFMMGMAHRGRLNVLANAVGKSMGEIFSKFEDSDPESVEGSGDVKYHIGADGEYRTPAGEVIQVSVAPNPSHLEAVDPVLEGTARAHQELLNDATGDLVLPVLMHGDAAFAGQGVVAETLNLSQLDGYYTGGTVHVVINNRIGFTTSPSEARSSLYCTDVARIVQAPIFHVNGDDPEAVLRAINLAYRFRHRFHKDVVVDMVCYRRHGHNEGDDPSLTQPVLYREIEKHPSVRTLYAQRLEAAGALAPGAGDALFKQEFDRLAASAEAGFENGLAEAGEGHHSEAPVRPSAVAPECLTVIGRSLAAVPSGFTVHPKLKAFLERRAQAVDQRKTIDWSLAEALALGSLATEGTPVRLVGQDTGRGTFSQRHAALYDYTNGTKYVALAHLPAQGSAAPAPFALYDTLLSEEAVLGFEFGYSMTHPTALVLWEAQFGDFVNGAQVIIDQFLSASLTKWGRTSGLALLLPHGYEGQGPEHSSARLERFLQLCAEENLQVANCTTAAQYFHLLRRQGLASATAARRPLIIFTPKSLLRHPEVPSPFEAFTSGSFQSVLPDAAISMPHRVLFCSGKIYYDLLKQRREMKDSTTALVRLEQLYPFPEEALRNIAEQCSSASEWLWVQEEPENMGAWRFVQPQLQELLGDRRLRYVGREASASPAAGSLRRHQNEQRAIVTEALAPSQVAAD